MDAIKLLGSLAVMCTMAMMGSPEQPPTDDDVQVKKSFTIEEWPTPTTEPIRDTTPAPVESFVKPTMEQCNCDCPDAGEMRTIVREEIRDALAGFRSSFSGNSSGGSSGSVAIKSSTSSNYGSSGGSSTPVQAYGVAQQTTTYQTSSVTAPLTVVSKQSYVGTDGCTYERKTMSDGSTQTVRVSCPARRTSSATATTYSRGLFGRWFRN